MCTLKKLLLTDFIVSLREIAIWGFSREKFDFNIYEKPLLILSVECGLNLKNANRVGKAEFIKTKNPAIAGF